MSGYISKDFVHRGCGLDINPDKVWVSVPYSVQKNIKKAESGCIRVEKVVGNADDIKVLKSMWYDPEDPNIPACLSELEYMFLAYNSENLPIGAIILLPVGNHLFLNNLAGNEQGKILRVQDYLLWYCVNHFKDSQFDYIDVGVSYRQTLYDFFKKWQTISYPVIFNVPAKKLNISLEPYCDIHYNPNIDRNKIRMAENALNNLLKGRKFTFVPNMEQAAKIIEINGHKFLNNSYNFLDETVTTPFVIDLTKIFSVQFGVLIVNLSIDDKAMWNEYRAWDPFKKEFVFTNIADELESISVLIARRKRNIDLLDHYFGLDRIKSSPKNEAIPSAFYFNYDLNDKYHNKLNDFGISHFYDENSCEIGLPIHQNLTKFHIEYLYAIFRGVLNLCSEWVHTDVYNDLK